MTARLATRAALAFDPTVAEDPAMADAPTDQPPAAPTVTAAAPSPPPPAWLVAEKARAGRGERPADKAFGRWLGDFLDQPGDSGLLEAELGLLLATARGFGYTAPQGSDATVRPGFLRFLAMGGDDTAPVHESGVQITGAHIHDDLGDDIDLRGARCVGRLILIDCRIDGVLKLEDAALGVLMLDASRIAGLLANRAVFSGSVFLQQGFRSSGTVRLLGAAIGGSLQAPGAVITVPAGQDALVCTGATIRGNVMLDTGFQADGPLWLNRAAIGGDLSLTGAEVAGGVTLTSATVGGAVYCTGAALTGPLSAKGARGLALDAGSAQIGRSLFMTPRTTPERRRFTALGGVRLSSARIGETLWASGAALDGAGETALDLSGAHVSGWVRIDQSAIGDTPAERFEARGLVDLRGATIDGGLRGAAAVLSVAPGANALVGSAATIRSDVSLDAGFTVEGLVWFNQAHIGGDFSLAGAKVSGGVALTAASINGDLYCTGATLAGAVGDDGAYGWALNAGSIHVGGSVNLDQAVDNDTPAAPFQARGLVYFGGATIDGDLLAPGGVFDNAAGALTLDRAHVAGQVCLNQLVWRLPAGPVPGARFEARGPVGLYGASIGGHLNCEGGLFTAPPAPGAAAPQGDVVAINGEILHVGGCIFLTGPDLEEKRRQPALAAFECHGQVMLHAARIDMQLSCLGGEMTNAAVDSRRKGASAFALNLAIAKVGYQLLLGPTEDDTRGPACIKGSINLTGAVAGGLYDRGFIDRDGPATACYPAEISVPGGAPLRCETILDGFTYDRLDSDGWLGLAARRAWLMRQPEAHTGGSLLSQPFDHLAASLDAMGHGGEARDIRILKEDRKTRGAPRRDKVIAVVSLSLVAALSWTGLVWLALAAILAVMAAAGVTGDGARSAEWLWRRIFGWGVAYGYRPGRGLAVALVMALVCGAFYQQAAAGGALGPAKGAAPATPFHPYVYSLDVMLPVAKLGEAEAWKPTGRPVEIHGPFGLGAARLDAAFTQKIVWLETAFGWLAGGILVAMASGLVRRGKDG